MPKASQKRKRKKQLNKNCIAIVEGGLKLSSPEMEL
jgi:hypothetical protein